MEERNKVNIPVLIFLTFFLGGIGAHKFYLRKHKEGYLYLLFSWTLIPSCLALANFFFFAFARKEKKQQYFEGKELIGRGYYLAGALLYFLPSLFLYLLITLPDSGLLSSYNPSPTQRAYRTATNFFNQAMANMANHDPPYPETYIYSRDTTPNVFDPRLDEDINIKGEVTFLGLYGNSVLKSTMTFAVKGSCYIIKLGNDACLHMERAPEYPECSEYAPLYPVVIQHVVHMVSPVTGIGLGINWISFVYWWDFYQHELFWKQKLSSNCWFES